MNYRGYFLLLGITCSLVPAFGATYSGRVIDNSQPAKPIANATVSLMGSAAVAYSDSSGRFSLNTEVSVLPRPEGERHFSLSFSKGRLSFSCHQSENVRIDLFTVGGKRACALFNRTVSAGDFSFALSGLIPKNIGSAAYIAAIEKGGVRYATKVFLANAHAGDGFAQRSMEIVQGKAGSATLASSSDNLIVFRMGYVAKTVPAAAADLGDIVLGRDPKEAEIDRKADSIIALLTINEKAGQMVQAQINGTGSFAGRLKDADIAAKGIGSVFNGGSETSVKGNTPNDWASAIDRIQNVVMTSSTHKIPIIYAQDCVHGVAEIAGCTVFPHNIGLGCTHDTALVAKTGRITAEECAGVGIRLSFSPCISSVRNERWGRCYEGFGETPEINGLMGAAFIRGMQGDGDMSKTGAAAACAKHYLGDGGTANGENNGKATISEATMRAVHLPQYAACARENMATVMPSYSSWVRIGMEWKQTFDPFALTTILKTELGFDGFCVSDWDAIPRGCGDYMESCVAKAVNAGLDMAMIVGDTNCSNFINAIVSGVGSNAIPISRVNDAVKRILRVKFRSGLFDHPLSDAALRAKINSAENRAVARECVRKSLVLLKNEDKALPLKKSENIVVVGQWANNLGAQCGGWTISWQGSISPSMYKGVVGQTIYEGLKAVGSNVTFDEAGTNLTNADKIVAVIGERPYAEGQGDIGISKAPDFSSATICPNSSLIQTCFKSGKPVILIMITGRPLVIDTELPWCKAIVAAWLPGSEGGGVADVLFGEYDFTGTLTHTWPASASQIPINTGPSYSDEQHGSGGEPLYPYGYGLKYN